jgi:hypothetical protein
MNLTSIAPILIALVCIALHRVFSVKLTLRDANPNWSVVNYLLGTLFMLGSFLFLMFKFSSSQAVVMGLYLGYNISYIVWGMMKSR